MICGLALVMKLGKSSDLLAFVAFSLSFPDISVFVSVTHFAVISRSWIFCSGFFQSLLSLLFNTRSSSSSFKLRRLFLHRARSANNPVGGSLHFCHRALDLLLCFSSCHRISITLITLPCVVACPLLQPREPLHCVIAALNSHETSDPPPPTCVSDAALSLPSGF